MKPKSKPNPKAKSSSRPATKRTKISAAEKSSGGKEKPDWDKALRDVFDKCINTLNEDVQSLSPKDRLAFIKAISDHFSPGQKTKNEPPGSDINEIKLTILHKCIDEPGA